MMLNPILEPGWLNAILPEILLALFGMLLMLLEAFAPRLRGIFAPITVIAIVITAWAEFMVQGGTFFGGTYQLSPLTRMFDFTFLLATLLAAMFAREYLARERIEGGEFYALLLWGTIGMMMMAKGLDLLIVILGLELLSICIFVLVGYHRRLAISNEASLKYFLMGAFATGFILYGTALFYGAAGSTNVTDLARFMSTASPSDPMLTIAFILLIAGLGFKLALAPFHAWAPDVYQGAPTPIAGWLSVAPKAATLITLIRLLTAMMPVAEQARWTSILAVLAVASMVVGNFVAIAQRDLKRMLAYSGIAHVGYMTIAVLTVRADAVAAVAIYAITYALMNIGAFGVVSLLQKNQNDAQTLSDIAGLGFRKPFYGFALAIFMFSLSGLPPTAGFISKFYVFKVAVDSGHLTLALIGILTSIVSVYYYLRVVYYLYMKEAEDLTPVASGGIFSTGALLISIVGILLIGLYPTPLFEAGAQAAQTLFMNR
ncbi:MAG TPA: NADH-quinone oxidoreductase subunit N [Thermoanaerobaculia bacterium]|nr:NADH-quinone oxidoreductase subunit N [Thermoanaerobaculia bacterium]